MAAGVDPIFEFRRERYRIDRCAAQFDAIRKGKITFHALTRGHYPGDKIKEGALPGISSLGFWDAAGAQDWGLAEHRNEGVEIVYLENGAQTFTVDNLAYPIRGGQFTVTRPWQLHKLGAPHLGPGRLHWFIIDVGVRRPTQEWHWPNWVILGRAIMTELTRRLRHNEHPVWKATRDLHHAFQDIAEVLVNKDDPTRYPRIAIQINRVLLGVLDALKQQQSYDDPSLTGADRTVEIFLRDLEQNQTNASLPWTLESMAHACGMSMTTFSKYCHRVVNTSAITYLGRCRLEHAARLLRDDLDRSITQVALDVGFSSSQYFATCFLRRFRRTPKAFRSEAAKGIGARVSNKR